ncbi:MAG: glycosyltransferase family 39 protein, partial [Phycisphaerae bacterium]|nr:glycosyltransferase family 39 protein [Phycisphaerae bacterium]
MANRQHLVLLLSAALVTYLIGNARVSLWDRDEPRYAQTSRQMVRSGDWVVPRLYDVVRTKKPPLVYWCQASCMAVFGDKGNTGAAAARMPSAIAMTATLAMLAIVIGGKRGVLAAFILGSTALVFWSAKSALTDSILLFFITAAQLGVMALWKGNRSWWIAIITAAAIGLGGLTKGPIVLAIPGATLLVLWIASPNRWAMPKITGRAILQLLVGILIIVAIVVPWLIQVEHRSPGFLRQALLHEVVDRARDPQEGHSGPPGYYFALIWATYFPWSLLLPAALVAAWKRREIPEVRFALAAVIGPWIMLEIYRTKLPHYLLPAYPFLAWMTADLLLDMPATLTGIGFKKVVTVWTVVIALVGLSPWILLRWFSLSTGAVIGLSAFTIIAMEFAHQVRRAFLADRPMLASTILGSGMFALVAALHIGFLPQADFLQISRRVAAYLPPGESARMIDYKEPSLAFYQGGT